MADSPVQQPRELRASPRRPAVSPLNHRTMSDNGERERERAAISRPPMSYSPLRSMDTNMSSSVRRRPHLSTNSSSTSRASSSLSAARLYNIPEERFSRATSIRTARTPEMSNLSIDEITSTRLSSDDRAILSELSKHNSSEAQGQKAVLKTTFGAMRAEDNGCLRKMTMRLKKIPSGLFSRKGRQAGQASEAITTQAISTLGDSLPQLDLTTESYLPATVMSTNSISSAHSRTLTSQIDFRDTLNDPTTRRQELAKLSSGIRKDLQQASNRDRVLPPRRTGINDPVPCHFREVPVHHNITSLPRNSAVYAAMDQRLHGPMRAAFARSTGRTQSVGSVRELRPHTFGSRRFNRPSLSGFSHSSAPSLGRNSYYTTRPNTQSSSVSSNSATMVPPPLPQFQLDAPNGKSHSLWPVSSQQNRLLCRSTERPASSESTATTHRDDHVRMSLGAPPIAQIGNGFGDHPEYNKLPVCVPRQVVASSLRRTPQRLPEYDDEDVPPSVPGAIEVSTPAMSETSWGSLSTRGVSSKLSHQERCDALRQPVEAPKPWVYNGEY